MRSKELSVERRDKIVSRHRSAAGTGRLVRIEAKMNGEKYKEILDENLLQSAQHVREGRRYYLPTGQRP